MMTEKRLVVCVCCVLFSVIAGLAASSYYKAQHLSVSTAPLASPPVPDVPASEKPAEGAEVHLVEGSILEKHDIDMKFGVVTVSFTKPGQPWLLYSLEFKPVSETKTEKGKLVGVKMTKSGEIQTIFIPKEGKPRFVTKEEAKKLRPPSEVYKVDLKNMRAVVTSLEPGTPLGFVSDFTKVSEQPTVFGKSLVIKLEKDGRLLDVLVDEAGTVRSVKPSKGVFLDAN